MNPWDADRTIVRFPDPAIEIVRNETIGKTISAAERAFRGSWLGAEAPISK